MFKCLWFMCYVYIVGVCLFMLLDEFMCMKLDLFILLVIMGLWVFVFSMIIVYVSMYVVFVFLNRFGLFW